MPEYVDGGTPQVGGGPQGISAYQVAVNNGFSGTESDWIISLIGATGNNGNDGISAYQVAVINGFSGTESDWLISLIGQTGNTGNNGNDGISAYQNAVNNGFSGTESDWLISLTGPTGNNGNDGISAYQNAVNNGFSGTESDWLISLIGPQGEFGLDGPTGIQGQTGQTGIQGQTGNTGQTGQTGIQGQTGNTGQTGIQGNIGPIGPIGPTGAAGTNGSGTVNNGALARLALYPANGTTLDDEVTYGAFTASVSFATQTLIANRLYTIPDIGANASFILSEGAQAINGIKTFGAIPVFSLGYTVGNSVLLARLNSTPRHYDTLFTTTAFENRIVHTTSNNLNPAKSSVTLLTTLGSNTGNLMNYIHSEYQAISAVGGGNICHHLYTSISGGGNLSYNHNCLFFLNPNIGGNSQFMSASNSFGIFFRHSFTNGNTTNLYDFYSSRFPGTMDRYAAFYVQNKTTGTIIDPLGRTITGTSAFTNAPWSFFAEADKANLGGGLLIDNTASLTTVLNAWLEIQAGTATRAQIRLRAGAAPTSPTAGEIWWDGTNLKFRTASATINLA